MKINETINQELNIRSGNFRESTIGMSEQGQHLAAFYLRDKIYTDKPLAVVREILGNAVDEHRKYSIDKMIDVLLPHAAQASPEFSVRDYAKGLSDHDVRNVFGSYFESTKSHSNDSIGGFGIGAKAPHSYTDTFTVTSWFEGVCRIYSFVLEGGSAKGQGKILELGCFESDEPSGIKVTVAVKREDIQKFQDSYSRFAGFLKKYVAVEGYTGETIDVASTYGSALVCSHPKNSSAFRLDSRRHVVCGFIPYQVSEYLLSDCLDEAMKSFKSDRMKYIGFHKRGGNNFNIIRVNIGQVDVALNRETIEDTPRTRATITKAFKDYLEKAQEEFKKFEDELAKAKTPKEFVAVAKKHSETSSNLCSFIVDTLSVLKNTVGNLLQPIELGANKGLYQNVVKSVITEFNKTSSKGLIPEEFIKTVVATAMFEKLSHNIERVTIFDKDHWEKKKVGSVTRLPYRYADLLESEKVDKECPALFANYDSNLANTMIHQAFIQVLDAPVVKIELLNDYLKEIQDGNLSSMAAQNRVRGYLSGVKSGDFYTFSKMDSFIITSYNGNEDFVDANGTTRTKRVQKFVKASFDDAFGEMCKQLGIKIDKKDDIDWVSQKTLSRLVYAKKFLGFVFENDENKAIFKVSTKNLSGGRSYGKIEPVDVSEIKDGSVISDSSSFAKRETPEGDYEFAIGTGYIGVSFEKKFREGGDETIGLKDLSNLLWQLHHENLQGVDLPEFIYVTRRANLAKIKNSDKCISIKKFLKKLSENKVVKAAVEKDVKNRVGASVDDKLAFRYDKAKQFSIFLGDTFWRGDSSKLLKDLDRSNTVKESVYQLLISRFLKDDVDKIVADSEAKSGDLFEKVINDFKKNIFADAEIVKVMNLFPLVSSYQDNIKDYHNTRNENIEKYIKKILDNQK